MFFLDTLGHTKTHEKVGVRFQMNPTLYEPNTDQRKQKQDVMSCATINVQP